LDKALELSAELLEMWEAAQGNPSAQLFTGGLWDSWPAYVVDAFSILRAECAAIAAHIRAEELTRG